MDDLEVDPAVVAVGVVEVVAAVVAAGVDAVGVVVVVPATVVAGGALDVWDGAVVVLDERGVVVVFDEW